MTHNLIDGLMLESLVMLVSTFALVLISVLVLRVFWLYKQEQHWLTRRSELIASNIFQQLQVFSKFHLQPIRLQTSKTDLNDFSNPSEKRKLIALYLIGAAEYLGKQQDLSVIDRKVLAFCILEQEMKANMSDVWALYDEAKSLKGDSNKSSIKLGARALGHWHKKGTSNQRLSLQALVS